MPLFTGISEHLSCILAVWIGSFQCCMGKRIIRNLSNFFCFTLAKVVLLTLVYFLYNLVPHWWSSFAKLPATAPAVFHRSLCTVLPLVTFGNITKIELHTLPKVAKAKDSPCCCNWCFGGRLHLLLKYIIRTYFNEKLGV